MRHPASVFAICGLLACAVFAQSPAPSPSFNAAEVHVHPRSSNPNPFMTGGVLKNGRYDLRNGTMVDRVSLASRVNAESVLGGPNWLP